MRQGKPDSSLPASNWQTADTLAKLDGVGGRVTRARANTWDAKIPNAAHLCDGLGESTFHGYVVF